MSETETLVKSEKQTPFSGPALEIDPPAGARLAAAVKLAANTDVNACFQCRKCTSGCPVAYAMDYTPAQIMHAVRLGLKDLVLGSSTIWLCAACETCVARCPQGVDIVKAMDALRGMCLSEGYKPKEPEVAAFYKYSLNSIQVFGRLYELGVMGRLKLATREFRKDWRLGLGLFKRGKLKVIPDFGSVGEMRRMEFRVVRRKV
jgi:heterodisulfide reductase subunit C